MKELQVVIQPSKLNEVADALQALPGVNGLTALQALGFGQQRGALGVSGPALGAVSFVPKVLLFVVVADEAVEDALAAIEKYAQTGSPGDGKVFVVDVLDALRLRTGARGDAAL